MKRYLGLLLLGLATAACNKHISDSDGWDLGVDGSPDLSASADLASSGQPSLSLIAGAVGGSGNLDGKGRAARFNLPAAAALDGKGNLYVSDAGNFAIRKVVLSSGEVTLFAGGGRGGSTDGVGTAARFGLLGSLVADGTGKNLYVVDRENNTIRQIVLGSGQVTTIAGSAGAKGSTDGIGAAARFSGPTDLTLGDAGELYIVDTENQTIRKLVLSTQEVTTIAGSVGAMGSSDGTGTGAQFHDPMGATTDGGGNLYVADTGNHTIRKLVLGSGVVTTIAGSAGMSGSVDGNGTGARFSYPQGITTDRAGNLFILDSATHDLRRMGLVSTAVTTIAGRAYGAGSSDGIGDAARFFFPQGLTFDGVGNFYIADTTNNTIRKFVLGLSAVTTIAGSAGSRVSVDGNGSAATFYNPHGVTSDGAGNLYVADTNGHTVRQVALDTGAVTMLAGSGSTGSNDGVGAAARFELPAGIAADRAGNVFVSDTNTHTIRQIVVATRAVTTIAGMNEARGSSDGIGTAAGFSSPNGLAADSQGSLYVADTNNHTIRKIVVATRQVTTIAGAAGVRGSSDGIGTAARFSNPWALALDSTGNLFICDTNNFTIRKMVLQSGVVTTIAGTAGLSGSSDGIGAAARFSGANGIAVDTADNLYVADFANSSVRLITRGNATVTTLAGLTGQKGLLLGPLPGRLNQPMGVVSVGKALYIADTAESAILVIQ